MVGGVKNVGHSGNLGEEQEDRKEWQKKPRSQGLREWTYCSRSARNTNHAKTIQC
jgi:hypothetical protein